jgi:putative transcriptional regulator
MEDDEIIINLDVMLAKRKMQLTELSELVGTPITNLSIFKNGKGKAIKLTTLMRMCKVLKCTPNDIIEFRDNTPAKPVSQVPRFINGRGEPQKATERGLQVNKNRWLYY